MTELFAIVEQSTPSIFLRESLWAFPLVLVLHAFGMAMLVGPALVLALRRLGVARAAPAAAFAPFRTLMWLGFSLALASGLLLVAAYPAKALTNPVFHLKLAGMVLALTLALRLSDGRPAALHAAASLALWAGVIVAGRLLAYTHSVLLVS